MFTADVLIEAFAVDSVAARAEATGGSLHGAAAAVYCADAADRAAIAARRALAAMGAGDRWPTLQPMLQREPVDTLPERRLLADAALAQEDEDAWIAEQVAAGHPVDGLFPMNAEWRARFETERSRR